jgi:hypothetical protein
MLKTRLYYEVNRENNSSTISHFAKLAHILLKASLFKSGISYCCRKKFSDAVNKSNDIQVITLSAILYMDFGEALGISALLIVTDAVRDSRFFVAERNLEMQLTRVITFKGLIPSQQFCI